VLPLWVADMDFRAAPPILAALEARLRHGVLGYTVPPAELRAAIVERLERLYAWRVDPAWIVFLPGVVAGLYLAARRLAGPQEHLIVPKPVYHHVKRAPEAAPRAFSEVPLVLERGRWVYDEDALRASVNPRTRLLFLCNPQNPGGTVFRRAELERLAELARDAVIVSDEIHCDLVLDPQLRHVPIASLAPEISRRTVTLMSPSKTFNTPGVACAWAIVEDPALRAAFAQELAAHVLPSPSVFGYAAALAAYREGGAWLCALLGYLRANEKRVREAIGAIPALSTVRVEATYLAWIDCAGLGVEDPYEHFLRHGLALSPGAQFGDARFVRLNFGTQRSVLEEALRRIRSASTPSPRG
jgi:putative C-S lyase